MNNLGQHRSKAVRMDLPTPFLIEGSSDSGWRGGRRRFEIFLALNSKSKKNGAALAELARQAKGPLAWGLGNFCGRDASVHGSWHNDSDDQQSRFVTACSNSIGSVSIGRVLHSATERVIGRPQPEKLCILRRDWLFIHDAPSDEPDSYVPPNLLEIGQKVTSTLFEFLRNCGLAYSPASQRRSLAEAFQEGLSDIVQTTPWTGLSLCCTNGILSVFFADRPIYQFIIPGEWDTEIYSTQLLKNSAAITKFAGEPQDALVMLTFLYDKLMREHYITLQPSFLDASRKETYQRKIFASHFKVSKKEIGGW